MLWTGTGPMLRYSIEVGTVYPTTCLARLLSVNGGGFFVPKLAARSMIGIINDRRTTLASEQHQAV